MREDDDDLDRPDDDGPDLDDWDDDPAYWVARDAADDLAAMPLPLRVAHTWAARVRYARWRRRSRRLASTEPPPW